jgi:hypothetical protein
VYGVAKDAHVGYGFPFAPARAKRVHTYFGCYEPKLPLQAGGAMRFQFRRLYLVNDSHALTE